MFVTTLEMDNFDRNECTFQKIHSLSMGGAHSRVEAYIASPTSPPYDSKQLTTMVQHACVLKCSNDNLCILAIKA